MVNVNQIKLFLESELYCPYEDCNLKVSVDMDRKDIHVETNTWEISMGLGETDDSFCLSTKESYGIDQYELEYIMNIKDSRKMVYDIWSGKIHYNEETDCLIN